MSRAGRLRAMLAACGAALLQIRWALSVPVGSLNDDGLHLLLARAARAGLFALPDGTGRPVTDPLPGFALFLALPEKLLGGHWDALRLLALSVSWFCLWATWRLARRCLPLERALAVVFLVALNNVFLIYCGVLMPDILFTGLTALALAQFGEGRISSAAALAAVACLLRPEGVLAAGAIALALAARGGIKSALGFFAGALVPISAWTLRNRLVAGTATHYLSVWSDGAGLSEPGAQALHVKRLAATLLGEGFLGLVGLPFWALVAAAVAVLAAAALGAARLLRREPPNAVVFAAAVFAAGLLLLHASWPIQNVRYLLPLLPILWILVLAAAPAALDSRPALLGLLAVALCAPSLRNDLRYLAPRPEKTVWPETVAWIKANTPEHARLQSPFNGTLMYLTGRPVLYWFAEQGAPGRWLAAALGAGIEYEVVDLTAGRWTGGPDSGPYLRQLGWLSGPYVRQVYRNEGEGSAVYRIEHPDPARYLKAWGLCEKGLETQAVTVDAKIRCR